MRQENERVRVKQNLIVDAEYAMENGHKDVFILEMVLYLGCEALIEHVDSHGYRLDIDRDKCDFTWTDDMLEDAE